MLTLYYAPNSRATTLISLLHTMGKLDDVTVKTVEVKRFDGSGNVDPANPHPEGKVPVLDTGSYEVRERGAIILWLTDHFDHALGRGVDHPSRAAYLTWLFYYQGVMETVIGMKALGLLDTPGVHGWVRGVDEVVAELEDALADKPFLVDGEMSAADLLVSSAFYVFPDLAGDSKAIAAWLARVGEAVDMDFLMEFEAIAMAKLNAIDPVDA